MAAYIAAIFYDVILSIAGWGWGWCVVTPDIARAGDLAELVLAEFAFCDFALGHGVSPVVYVGTMKHGNRHIIATRYT